MQTCQKYWYYRIGLRSWFLSSANFAVVVNIERRVEGCCLKGENGTVSARFGGHSGGSALIAHARGPLEWQYPASYKQRGRVGCQPRTSGKITRECL